jgi:antitoxin YefM
MHVVNFSDARNNLKDVIDRVVQDADVTVITRRDAPNAVLMSLDRYNSLLETVHLLSSPPMPPISLVRCPSYVQARTRHVI